MRMAFRLNIEQSQRLVMTPELRQAITVLQLSALELSEYIEQGFWKIPFSRWKMAPRQRTEQLPGKRNLMIWIGRSILPTPVIWDI